MSLSLGNTSRRSSVYMGSIALAFLALQGASDLVNNDQDYCGGLICQVAAMDATEIVSAPGSSKVTTGGPKGGRFLQRSGRKGSPQNNVSCSHGPDCNCDGLTNRRNLSANGGYYQCDSAKMLSDDDCIFTVTGSEPAAWSGKTVPHNIDRTVGTNHYRQIAKIDGTKYTAVTSVPWTNGDKLVKSKKALFGDIWHYTLAFEIIAPLRDKMMNDPSSLDSMAEWSKYTKSIKDCRVKIENYEYTDDGKTKIEYGLDDVHTVLKNAYTQNVVAAEFVHHTILQFLEEAAIDLVCLMTEKFDSTRCTKIRTDIWGIEFAKGSGVAFNCWQAGYKGLYDVDSALQEYIDGRFVTLDSWSVANADSNWSKIKTKNEQKVSKPAKMQHTLRSWAWELADGTSAESLDKDSTFKTTVALMLCDRLSKASDKVDLGNCSDKTNKSVEVTRISAAAAKKRLLLESSRSVLRRRLAASVDLDVEYVVNIPDAEEASAALESAASDAGTFAKVDESFAAAKSASGLSEPLPAYPVPKQDFADKIAKPAFKDNAGNAVDASGNAIVENDGSSSDDSDDSTVIIIVAAVAGVLLACGALVYKLKLSKSSAAHAKSQVTDNKSKTASIV